MVDYCLDRLQMAEGSYLDLLSLAGHTTEPYFMIQGNTRTGKTSILFHQAILASQEGREVLMISPNAPLKLPALPPGNTPEQEHLKLIQLKYPATQSELIQLLAAVHESTFKPSLILLDCLEVYARGEGGAADVMKLAKILALLRDAINFWSCQSCDKTIPVFIGTETCHHVVSRWIPHNITVEREFEKSLILTVNSPVKVSCRFSLENSQFTRLSEASQLNEN